ncbi:MAG: putative orf, partial [Candidatus Brocadia sinica]
KLLGAKYDVLLYDLTSAYFESDPPPTGSGGKKRFGYSRDKRSDCVQVLTPEGFPVAYEVYPGNTRDTATLEEFLDRIEKQYGKFRRTWLMDRGIPTEDMLEKMRSRGIDYLVGTPKGHLTRVEKPLLEQTWMQARESVSVKSLQQESKFYVSVKSHDRVAKDRFPSVPYGTNWKRELKPIFLSPFWLFVSTRRCEILRGNEPQG